MCGLVYIGPNNRDAASRQAPPRTFGQAISELVGCGCKLPYNKWDRHGLQWCKENINTITKHLMRKPKPGLDKKQAVEMIQLAIKIAEPK